MAASSDDILTKHSINLRHGDYPLLQDSVVGTSVTASDIIRRLVSSYVDKNLATKLNPQELKKIPVELEEPQDNGK